MSFIRPAEPSDLPAIVDIYNHYIEHTPVTFDIELVTVETRRAWFDRFGETGRYRLFVADVEGQIVGYAGTIPFRPKAAYETTVETTIYLHPDRTGGGIGRRLYEALFASLAGEDVRRVVAGMTLPNDASQRLHESLGFEFVGIYHEVGRKFGRYWDVAWYERSAAFGTDVA